MITLDIVLGLEEQSVSGWTHSRQATPPCTCKNSTAELIFWSHCTGRCLNYMSIIQHRASWTTTSLMKNRFISSSFCLYWMRYDKLIKCLQNFITFNNFLNDISRVPGSKKKIYSSGFESWGFSWGLFVWFCLVLNLFFEWNITVKSYRVGSGWKLSPTWNMIMTSHAILSSYFPTWKTIKQTNKQTTKWEKWI